MANAIIFQGSSIVIKGKDTGDSTLTFLRDNGNTTTVKVSQCSNFSHDLHECGNIWLVNVAIASGFAVSADVEMRI